MNTFREAQSVSVMRSVNASMTLHTIVHLVFFFNRIPARKVKRSTYVTVQAWRTNHYHFRITVLPHSGHAWIHARSHWLKSNTPLCLWNQQQIPRAFTWSALKTWTNKRKWSHFLYDSMTPRSKIFCSSGVILWDIFATLTSSAPMDWKIAFLQHVKSLPFGTTTSLLSDIPLKMKGAQPDHRTEGQVFIWTRGPGKLRTVYTYIIDQSKQTRYTFQC